MKTNVYVDGFNLYYGAFYILMLVFGVRGQMGMMRGIVVAEIVLT